MWIKEGSYKNISSYSHLSYNVSRPTWLVSWSSMVIGTSRRDGDAYGDLYISIMYTTISSRNLETPLLDVPITIRDQETSQVGLKTS